LLFTRFGRDRSRKNIFLFDEPAANLHAKAQAELLSSFGKLAQGGDVVIYSTHSHHMIEPRWLSSAYIVANDAIDYDQVDSGGIATKDTNIHVTSYRQFVGENGSRVSYFQPVLDRLNYYEGALSPSGTQILVEGISDFYALSYAARRLGVHSDVTIVPGTGSGSLSTLISLALARGASFFVLLDDDTAGRKAAIRYRELFYLTNAQVGTIGDLLPDREGAELESLVSPDTLEMVRAAFGNAKKQSVGQYLAEACRLDTPDAMSEGTLEAYGDLIAGAAARLGR
jgi:predicted ATP-dependent endonuclease of OLD family